MLFVRQGDIEADGFGLHVVGTAIRGFHDAGPSAGDNHVIATTVDLAGRRNQAAELTRHVIVFRESELSSRDRHLLLVCWIVRGSSSFLFGHVKRMLRGGRFL